MSIYIETPRLKTIDKKGVLTPDSDGYYTVVLGGLDIVNSVGEFYPYKENKEMFSPNSILQRRIKNGHLYAELGHPKKEAGMSSNDFLRRVLRIEETNICAHIKEVWLDTEAETPDGRKFIAIMGKIKPAGPKKSTIEDFIKEPGINLAFSVRSLAKAELRNGRIVKIFKNILNWDVVAEPGIAVATKWDNPTLESHTEELVTPTMIRYVIEEATDQYAMESAKEILKELETDMKISKKPIWSKW